MSDNAKRRAEIRERFEKATLLEAHMAVAAGEATSERYIEHKCGCVEGRRYFRDSKGFISYLARAGRACVFHRHMQGEAKC